MKTTKAISFFVVLSPVLAIASACISRPPGTPDVTTTIRRELDRAGLNDVSVDQDRDKNVVTLTGKVPTDKDKMQAESIARSIAGTQVVANEIAVRSAGEEGPAKKLRSDLDQAIDSNLEARLVQMNLNHEVRYDVRNGVVTLKEDAPSQSKRTSVEKVASDVPNVKQVVNKLEVKNQKTTSAE